MDKVKVIDSMMGTGKTSYAIQLMQEAGDSQKFIYVTPFLDEVKRIRESVTNRKFKEPDVKHGDGTKLDSLKRLIANGEDIATTHALFAMADDELMDLLKWENYTLMIDEVMEVISVLQTVKKGDITILEDSGTIEIDPRTIQVHWTADPKLNTKYNEVKSYALAGNLFSVNNTAFLWNFPAKIFGFFDQVFIMTYMFEGQLQRYYYDLHKIKYDYSEVTKVGERYELVSRVYHDRSHLKQLIIIHDSKLNDIGQKQSLSKSWFENKKNAPKISQLKNNLYNYYRNYTNSKADDFIWTTYKDYKKHITGNGFGKEESKNNTDSKGKACFVPFNLRATNRYKHKTTLAFCLNRYMNPMEEQFFAQRGVKVNEELFALTDLLQWIFRSAIRDGKPVDIYIPSKRMRDLLSAWLNNET
ncbi:DEAD/DEAH box helicase family protein [Desulfosporosinus sp. Sb-LF]|uniref:DEAD/DEAH box helicase family protein n=1 Tax=Desulfosporosinus sp. Sb-LF TaxID=2560027 RepID=UPI00107F4C93|nr:DEAD/DEAH box helicase family protein [Desulfosporosinus sp. Sb-LF]TGE32859.1 hypothetical protein E4K68_08395 [Desulfosporosinus sp. Sb-LF]